MLGLQFVLHAEIFLGNTLVIVSAFNFPALLSYIQKYRMTKLFLVPPVVIRLVKDPLTSEYDLSSLEQITSGAAPLGSDAMALMHSKFKNIISKQGIPVPKFVELIA
jgi:4-coumarate--CoA ligase